VLYSESDDSEYSSKRLAQICLDEVSDMLESRKIGLLEGDKIYIVRTSQVPMALIEVGFITNREELSELVTEEYQQLAAEGIYAAIMRAFEEGY
jgi:N-acetylmuramoyl-L-alanine amidase